MGNTNIFHELTCPTCGKKFFKPVENVYKVKNGKHTQHLCSWTCYVKTCKEIGKW